MNRNSKQMPLYCSKPILSIRREKIDDISLLIKDLPFPCGDRALQIVLWLDDPYFVGGSYGNHLGYHPLAVENQHFFPLLYVS